MHRPASAPGRENPVIESCDPSATCLEIRSKVRLATKLGHRGNPERFPRVSCIRASACCIWETVGLGRARLPDCLLLLRFCGSVMEFEDRTLPCVGCGRDFIFTAGEQLFFYIKQFQHDPKRCKPCRAELWGKSSIRPETLAICGDCGAQTVVPFKPTRGTPVLC